jgi:hypothetical protein
MQAGVTFFMSIRCLFCEWNRFNMTISVVWWPMLVAAGCLEVYFSPYIIAC